VTGGALAVSGSFLTALGEALGMTLMLVVWLYVCILVVLAPSFILYKILRMLAWLAGRIRGPRWHR
jgi:lauroyl/myristoyl acyltransferase